MVLGFGLVGALIDAHNGPASRGVLSVCFVAGCVLAALLVRGRDLRSVVVTPPLVFCALAVARGLVGKTSASSIRNLGLEVVTSLILGAPALFAGTGAALVVALVRNARRRSR